MRKGLSAVLLALLVLSGCAPTFEKQDQVVQEDQDSQAKKAIIPSYQISEGYYKTLLPYEPSATRGVVVNNLESRYDLNEFETGLLRMAKKTFSTKSYLFKEGQILSKETIDSWLQRKYTSAQLKERKLKDTDNVGLNPVEEKGQNEPIYLAHIIEHNYLMKKEGDKVQLGGVVIGLALNSVEYSQTSTGATSAEPISNETIKQQGAAIASEVLKRLREREELQGVPITIALFKQTSRDSIVPGSYFAFTNVKGEESTISNWEAVNESHFVFPSPEAKSAHSKDVNVFEEFATKVQTYFPTYTGTVGRAFYQDNKLKELRVEIPLTFKGKAETIGFTQYLSTFITKQFPADWNVEVLITASSNPEALILKKPNSKDPYVHVYE